MLAAAIRHQEALPVGHPCLGCEVRSTAVCGVLNGSELARFKGMSWTVALAPGQPLFHEGDPATRVFTLTRGCLKLYKLLPDGRRQVTGFMFPGDFLGISIDDEHAFTAESLEESELCWFPRNRFDVFVDEHGQLERELYRVAAHELAAAQQQMVLLGRKTAAERVASFFLMLAGKAGRRGAKAARFVDLPMSRSDIADYLGLTKETVSRVLSSLRRDRLIRLEALDRIEILDREGLVEVADGGLEL
jgi:CRP/FNR family transcriptional regulator